MAKRELKVRITADTKSLNKGVDKSKKSVSSLADTAKKAGLALAAAFAARHVVRGLQDIVKSASDAQETFSKFNTVYDDVASSAEESFKRLRNEYGLSSKAAKELLSNTGDLLTGFGFAGSEALRLSEEVNKLAVDLASFTNFAGGAKGASDALTKALLGERESVKALGISILEQDVQAQMLANTKKGLTFETERQAKAQATLDIAIKQSQNAIGDYERTSDSMANQSRLLKQRLNDLAVTLGQTLIPSTTRATTALVGFVEKADGLLKDIVTEGNMSKLEKFGRIIGGTLASIATGGRYGEGISEPVWIDAMAARTADASENIAEIRANLENITDEEEMRAALQDKIFEAQKKSASYQKTLNDELAKSRKDQNKNVIAFLEAEVSKSTDTYKTLQSNFEEYIQAAIAKREEEADKAAELAERERREQREDEAKRREALGEIGRLEEDIKKEQEKYIEANTKQERINAKIRIDALERELKLIEDIAEARAEEQTFGPKPDVQKMGMISPEGFTTTEAHLDKLREKINLTRTEFEGFSKDFDNSGENINQWAMAAGGAVAGLATQLGAMAAGADKSFASMASSMLDSISSIINGLLAQSIAGMIAGESTKGLIGLATAAVGVGAIKTMFSSKVPEFADGGKVTSPTLAMFGEYPGARTNPEYALREDQLRNITGGGGELKASFRRDEMIVWLDEGSRRINNSF